MGDIGPDLNGPPWFLEDKTDRNNESRIYFLFRMAISVPKIVLEFKYSLFGKLKLSEPCWIQWIYHAIMLNISFFHQPQHSHPREQLKIIFHHSIDPFLWKFSSSNFFIHHEVRWTVEKPRITKLSTSLSTKTQHSTMHDRALTARIELLYRYPFPLLRVLEKHLWTLNDSTRLTCQLPGSGGLGVKLT